MLDYGRFFAALSVVVFHYFYGGFNTGKISSVTQMAEIADIAKYGFFGVDFFFMISGYVIFFSASNRSASQFVVSRLVRLYPAFWVALIFTSVVTLFWGTDKITVAFDQVIANFTMLAPLFGHKFVDGVYWTLVKELFFYFAVFCLLLVGLQKKLETAFLLWPFIMLLALLIGKDWLPYLGNHYYYFAAGALFAIVKEKPEKKYYFALVLTYLLCLNFSVQMDNYSSYLIATIISSFYLLFLFLNSAQGSGLTLPYSALLGALTYPVYLIHAHFGYMFIFRFATEENKNLIFFLAFLSVILVAFLIHEIIEKRLHYFWKSLFSRTFGRIVEYIELGAFKKL